MKAIGYVRVSTEKQAEKGVSLDAQMAKIQAAALLHEYALIDIIQDGGESAKSLDRPGMAHVLDLVRTKAVDAVIIVKLDRLTRSVRDLADLLDVFTKYGVSLISISESLDTGSAAGRLVLNIMTAVSQWEREAIGERTRDALRFKKAQGERVGNIAFGYRSSIDGVMLEQNPEEQALLDRVRCLRESGYTISQIADALNAQGLRTRRGGKWHFVYVSRLLKMPVAA
ncbi:MAG: recombinase family protein [Bryobacteraceae bacterium]